MNTLTTLVTHCYRQFNKKCLGYARFVDPNWISSLIVKWCSHVNIFHMWVKYWPSHITGWAEGEISHLNNPIFKVVFRITYYYFMKILLVKWKNERQKIPHCPNISKIPHCQNISKIPHCQNISKIPHCQNIFIIPHCQNSSKIPHCQNISKIAHCQNISKIAHCRNISKI
jgi:hypothetical protein